VTIRDQLRHVLTAALLGLAVTASCARAVAAQATEPPAFRAITAGDQFSCAITADDRAFCWGANYLGQLGTPRSAGQCSDAVIAGDCSRFPIPIAGDVRFASVRAGKTHACGIDLDAVAWCWGESRTGQLATDSAVDQCRFTLQSYPGYPPVPCSRQPRAVPSSVRFVAIGAGDDISCALDEHGIAWCWGSLGKHGAPTRVPLDLPLKSISVAAHRACGLSEPEGLLRCWSWPDVMEKRFETPAGDRQWSAVAVASDHGCAIDAEDSTVACWGNDADGALGRGRRDHRRFRDDSLAPIASRAHFRSLALSSNRSCGVDAGQALICWGRLGHDLADDECLDSNGFAGSNDCTSTPHRVEPGSRVLGVTLGERHGCALLVSGASVCWGSNNWGEVGDGTRVTAASFSRLAGSDRSASPVVWVREHWPARKTFIVAAVALLACIVVIFAARWRPRSPAGAPAARERSGFTGFAPVALVVSGWVVLGLAIASPRSGGHDDVALGLAWLAILMAGAISCCLALAGGAVAVVTLRRDSSLVLARVGLILAALTIAAAGGAWALLAAF